MSCMTPNWRRGRPESSPRSRRPGCESTSARRRQGGPPDIRRRNANHRAAPPQRPPLLEDDLPDGSILANGRATLAGRPARCRYPAGFVRQMHLIGGKVPLPTSRRVQPAGRPFPTWPPLSRSTSSARLRSVRSKHEGSHPVRVVSSKREPSRRAQAQSAAVLPEVFLFVWLANSSSSCGRTACEK